MIYIMVRDEMFRSNSWFLFALKIKHASTRNRELLRRILSTFLSDMVPPFSLVPRTKKLMHKYDMQVILP